LKCTSVFPQTRRRGGPCLVCSFLRTLFHLLPPCLCVYGAAPPPLGSGVDVSSMHTFFPPMVCPGPEKSIPRARGRILPPVPCFLFKTRIRICQGSCYDQQGPCLDPPPPLPEDLYFPTGVTPSIIHGLAENGPRPVEGPLFAGLSLPSPCPPYLPPPPPSRPHFCLPFPSRARFGLPHRFFCARVVELLPPCTIHHGFRPIDPLVQPLETFFSHSRLGY